MAVQDCLPWEGPHARAPLAVRGDIEPGKKREGGCSCFISDFAAVLLIGRQANRLSRSPASTATAPRPARALPGCRHGGGRDLREAAPGRARTERARHKVGLPCPALPCAVRLSAAAR